MIPPEMEERFGRAWQETIPPLYRFGQTITERGASRGEVLKAKWDEFDLEKQVWTVALWGLPVAGVIAQ